jgi:hypothetical protein
MPFGREGPAVIRNPFADPNEKKKPTFKSPYDEGVDTEGPTVTPPEIILDGGRYTIYVKGASTAKEAGERLLVFFSKLDPAEHTKSKRLGINNIVPGTAPDEGCVALRYGTHAISIYVGDDKSAEAAYRRIGYVVQGLGLKELQKKYGITVIERTS